jgi:aryl-alcohol dehydrogenase-like predicted oxidoreductase
VLKVEDVREVSGEHHSAEKIIGRWLRKTGLRRQVVLVTKVTTNFTREHVREAIQASLERLKTDYIDLYLFHSFDRNRPLEESLESMNQVRESKLTRSAGCSNFTAEQVRAALGVARKLGLPRLELVEGIYNLAARDAETELLPFCQKEELGFLGYSPLGAGFLTGKYTGEPGVFPAGSRFHVIPGHADVYFNDRNFQIVRDLRALSDRTAVPVAQLALAWVLGHPVVTSVLFGARNRTQVDTALSALRNQAELSQTMVNAF